MTPKLGDLQSNMAQAEQLVQHALRKGARWIVLPEMFTSAMAFHPDMLGAIQPLHGAAMEMLKALSRQGNAMVGGSFLAQRGRQVFNTFALVSPDGSVSLHDKDLPTYWENCYYQGGSDNGILDTSIGPVGSVLCWELIRSATAKRLRNKVKLVLSGSCWWTLPDDADPDNPRRAMNLKMLQQAPARMARLLGTPVIHASHCGPFEGFFSTEIPDIEYHSKYLGEAMIVDATGTVLARRSLAEGAGVVAARVAITDRPQPRETIPQRFWMPAEMPMDWQESFQRWLDKGADYYKLVTQPYLASGKMNEYIPEYLR